MNSTLQEKIVTYKSLLPLDPLTGEAFWQKIRLEFNYHSNHLEGNTLTYGETEMLFKFGEVGGKVKIKDVDEMRAHNLALLKIIDYAADQTRLITQTDIREMNLLLLKEPFYKEAITLTGAPTRKKITPGEYKTTPNHVRTATGEIFYYTEPVAVQEQMTKLMDWLTKRIDDEATILETAILFHYRFVLIHPFDDGNGRLARLLMNYILLRHNYPPLVVKSEDKQKYLQALHTADTGNQQVLVDYMLSAYNWSLDLALSLAKQKHSPQIEFTN